MYIVCILKTGTTDNRLKLTSYVASKMFVNIQLFDSSHRKLTDLQVYTSFKPIKDKVLPLLMNTTYSVRVSLLRGEVCESSRKRIFLYL